MRQAMYVAAITLLITLVSFQSSSAQATAPQGDPIVIRVIDLDYADAEDLATILAPLLSPEGRIVAYARTNSLIIKDRASVVKRIVEIIKGPCDSQSTLIPSPKNLRCQKRLTHSHPEPDHFPNAHRPENRKDHSER